MTEQSAPPILSTPQESNLFEDPTPVSQVPRRKHTKEEIHVIYEVERTAREIIRGGWRRVALQFPDGMLGDAPGVFEGLEGEIGRLEEEDVEGWKVEEGREVEKVEEGGEGREVEINGDGKVVEKGKGNEGKEKIRLAILADTSYGSCCVDEIAAEHTNAEVVIHYGRACLSPTARLPVIYIYTTHPLDLPSVFASFEQNFEQEAEEGRGEKVIVMADLTYHSHVPQLIKSLQEKGWKNIRGTEVVHDPLAPIPNRKITWEAGENDESLRTWKIWHISQPPTSLLLTLSSRIAELLIYPTSSSSTDIRPQTSRLLSRRYALLTSLSTTPIIGILINTLSLKSLLPSLSLLKDLIHRSGKKSYTFCVGKVNSAKMANFSEVGGWVVVGCWESSLLEGNEFYAPVVTPFELGVALQSDEERTWGGDWRGDFSVLKEDEEKRQLKERSVVDGGEPEILAQDENVHAGGEGDGDSEEESEPPSFDLRTGRYVSHSRPMGSKKATSISSPTPSTTHNSSSNFASSSNPEGGEQTTLARRAKLDIATINGTASPGAEFLRSQRTWTGLGSDFDREDGEVKDEVSGVVEEGRRGVARGYVVGEEIVRT